MVNYTSMKPRYASDYPMLLLLACVTGLLIFSCVFFPALENIRQSETDTLTSEIKTAENNFDWKKWLEKNNIDWVLPIYQRATSEIWTYHCLGILIHPKAILTAEECIQPYESYATGVFKWKTNYNSTCLDKNILFKLPSTRGRLSHRLTTFGYPDDQNIKWIGKKIAPGIIIMSIENPIDSVNPVNLSRSLSLNDIYDVNFVKNCIHIIFTEIGESGEYVPKQIQETIMTRSELFGRFNKTYSYLYDSFNNVSVEFNYEASIFGTFDKLNFKSYDTHRGILGSPILCSRRDSFSPYLLTGLLTSQSHRDWYEYSGINQEKTWIKQKLYGIN